MDEPSEGKGTILKSISHPPKSELKYGLEYFFFCTVIFRSFTNDKGYFVIVDGSLTSNGSSKLSSKFAYVL
jgi:hypothetical protein